MSALSLQQQSILEWLLDCVRFAEQHNRQLLKVGFPWKPETNNKEDENSQRASLCRTLVRLEKRGLITRIKGEKNTRTVRVKLTRKGRKVAEEMKLINRSRFSIADCEGKLLTAEGNFSCPLMSPFHARARARGKIKRPLSRGR